MGLMSLSPCASADVTAPCAPSAVTSCTLSTGPASAWNPSNGQNSIMWFSLILSDFCWIAPGFAQSVLVCFEFKSGWWDSTNTISCNFHFLFTWEIWSIIDLPPSCLSSKVQRSTLKNKLNNALLDRSAKPLKSCYFCTLPRQMWCFPLRLQFALLQDIFIFFLQKAEMKPFENWTHSLKVWSLPKVWVGRKDLRMSLNTPSCISS